MILYTRASIPEKESVMPCAVFVKAELVVDNLLVVPITEEECKEKGSYPKQLNTAIENKDFKGELNQTLVIISQVSKKNSCSELDFVARYCSSWVCAIVSTSS